MSLRPCIVLGLLLGSACGVHAQSYRSPILEPQLLRLQVTGAYTGLRLEASQERTSYTDTANDFTFQRLFLGPVIGCNANGSIYHPNLLTFSFNGEISPGFEQHRYNAPGFIDKNGPVTLGNYQMNAILLGNKPYRLTLYGGQSYNHRNLDFFNQVDVFGTRYGATWGYQKGPVPFTINIWNRSEDISGALINSTLREVGMEFNARNKRERGESSFSYNYNDTTRTDGDAVANDTWHAFGLGNSETFGSRDQITLSTSAGYTTHTSETNPTDELTASANLQIEHSPTLSSLYDIDYDRNTTDSSVGASTTTNLHGGATLRHQLYKSLASTLRLQGIQFESEGSFVDASGNQSTTKTTNTRIGAMINEQYTKRLGNLGRLSLGASVLAENVNVDTGGSMLIITDERHSFSSFASGGEGNDTFFLNLPFVDESTIVITDDKNSVPAYQRGRDYTVESNGSMTLIRRTAISTIPDNSSLYVDYRAQSSPSGQYDSLTSLLNMRIDLWNGLLSLYGRMNSVQNNAPDLLRVQEMSTSALGVETAWRWLRAGVEYSTNDTSFSTYNNTRFFESFAFKPDAGSILNFDFQQSFAQYIQANRDEQNYIFMIRYQRRMSRQLSAHLDAGYSLLRSNGQDQSQAAFRPGIEFSVGRLNLQASYSIESWKYQQTSDRLIQQFILTARRDF